MNISSPPKKGRGASQNPAGRFERLKFETGEYSQLVELSEELRSEPLAEEVVGETRPRTEYFEDHSRSVLTTNDSPDVGFNASVNPYRGCEHGCAYCYARPTHEYLGLSAGLDFETKIFVKKDAPELLRKALFAKSWRPQPVNLSGVTDCYQPVERKLELTRRCVEVLNDFRNPFTVITKNFLVTRDIDLFREAAERDGVKIFISVTSLDADLAGAMEPRTSRPEFRLRAIEMLAKAGIPVGAMLAPIVPGLTDSEIPAILKAVARAGATAAGFVPLRLPYGLGPLFENWLETHFPERKERVLHRIREIRGGKLNDPNFTTRMRGEGEYAEQMRQLFRLQARKNGLDGPSRELSTAHFRRVDPSGQLTFF